MNYTVLNYLKNGVNRTDEARNALIFVAETDEKIFKSINDRYEEETVLNQINKVEPKTIYFNPNEIERIVLRKYEGMEK